MRRCLGAAGERILSRLEALLAMVGIPMNGDGGSSQGIESRLGPPAAEMSDGEIDPSQPTPEPVLRLRESSREAFGSVPMPTKTDAAHFFSVNSWSREA